MGLDEGTETIGVWVADSHDLVDEFDRVLGARDPGGYSRSAQIREAMQDRLTIERVLQDAGGDLTFGSERDRRMWVRQALLNQLRREQE